MDLQSITGSSSGNQNLGGMSYAVGLTTFIDGDYNHTDVINTLGTTTDNIHADTYLSRTATQDIVSAQGSNTGLQNLAALNMRYGAHRIIKDLIDNNPVSIADVTGIYQNKFTQYIDPLS